MHQKISKKIFIYLFFFVFVGTINNQKITNSYLFEIKNFQISGLEKNYKKELKHLWLDNLK